MPRIISVLSQKGGVAKTTVALSVARCLQLDYGASVALLDTDPQGSLRDWAQMAQEGMPGVWGVSDSRTLEGARNLPEDYVLVDGPGRLEELTQAAVAVSDLVVIPCRPGFFDVWGSKDTVDVVKAHQAQHGRPKACFVVTQARTGTRAARDIDEALEVYGLPVLKARTHVRVVYAESGAGTTVLDLEPNGPAAAEVRGIVSELLNLLKP